MHEPTPSPPEEAARRLRQLPRYLGFGKRRVAIEVEEQFSEAWVLMALLMTGVGLVFHLGALLTIAVALLVIALCSWLWNRLAFFGLDYRREFSVRRAFVGETVDLKLSVANQKLIPLAWLRIADTFPADLPMSASVTRRHDTNQGEFSSFWHLKWRERAERSVTIQAAQRGYYRFGPARLETGDLFGLFHSVHRLDGEQVLIVYPQVTPLVSLGLPLKEPFGDLRTPRFVFEDPTRTVGVRDYHPEDDFRQLHWKATARRQQLQTRVLEPASSHNLLVVLNVATMPQHWQGILPDRLERVISVAASICYHGLEQRWPTGLLANGALPRSDQSLRLLPGRASSQILIILEALAALTPFVTASVEDLIAAEAPRLPWGSTVVVVSAVVTDALAATLLDLQRVGRRVALLSLDPGPLPPALRSVLVYRLSETATPVLDLGAAVFPADRTLSQPDQRQWEAIREAGETLRGGPRTSQPGLS